MGPNNFNLPTDVAFAPKAEIYVSDGYGNPRVVKYTHEGNTCCSGVRAGTPPHAAAPPQTFRTYTRRFGLDRRPKLGRFGVVRSGRLLTN